MTTSEKKLRMLVFADLHAWDTKLLELMCDYAFDCCVLLGDIPQQALTLLRSLVSAPLFGVVGNHDDHSLLECCGIENLNGKAVTINGITLTGLSGSHRYKCGDYPMLTQRESIAAAKKLPAADILISHDTAYHLMGRTDAAHCGLKGISWYLSRQKPALNLCGHYHENVSKMYGKSYVRCVFGCTLAELRITDSLQCELRMIF